MSFGNPPLLAIEFVCVLVGIAIATGGGLLALRADVDRPLQCIPVFVAAIAIFLGGMALLCWFDPIAKQVAGRVAPKALEKPERKGRTVGSNSPETVLHVHVDRSPSC